MDNLNNLTSEQVNKIFKNARRIAKEHNTKVSTTKLWTLTLMTDYVISLDDVVSIPHNKNDLTLDLSVNEMVREFKQPKRTIVEALKALDKAGIIKRIQKDEDKSIPGVITEINREVFK